MNLANQLKNSQNVESKRMAGGIYAKIINHPNILRLLRKYNMLPSYCILDPISGYDAISGIAFVVPNHSVEALIRVERYIINLNSNVAELMKQSNIDTFDTSRIIDLERKALEYLGNLIIMVNLRRDTELGLPHADMHDVFIETQEVMPPEAYIVKKSSFTSDSNAVKKLKDAVRK